MAAGWRQHCGKRSAGKGAHPCWPADLFGVTQQLRENKGPRVDRFLNCKRGGVQAPPNERGSWRAHQEASKGCTSRGMWGWGGKTSRSHHGGAVQ